MNNRRKSSVRFVVILALLSLTALLFLNFSSSSTSITKNGTLKITFKNTVNGILLTMDSVEYNNIFGEAFRVSKFKYYISNVSLENKTVQQKEKESYHLADARDSTSLGFSYPVAMGEYKRLTFLLGVDSLRNCSGAQAGALDPMNDMFWTWNSGYVMAKLEGISPAATAVTRRMEYHIGGYRNNNNVVQKIILLASTPIIITEGNTTAVIIETDISKWWQTKDRITIAENPVCTTPGQMAKRIAANYSNMFSIKNISDH